MREERTSSWLQNHNSVNKRAIRSSMLQNDLRSFSQELVSFPDHACTVGQNGDFADIRGYLKGTKCCRGSWQLVLTYERDKSNGSQKALKLLYSGGLIL